MATQPSIATAPAREPAPVINFWTARRRLRPDLGLDSAFQVRAAWEASRAEQARAV